MSLILEALRKSEAERRRGQAPSLYSELPVPGKAATPRRPWPWVLAALALVIAAIGWWRPSLPTPIASPSEPDSTPAAVPGALPNAAPRFDEPAVELTRAAPSPPPAVPVPAPLPAAIAPRPTSPPAAPTVEAAPAPLDAAREPSVDAVLDLAELDPQSRAALPPLRLSMHVWHETPAERFAVVDGQRVGEGDRLGEAVIEQIEPEGLRLFWRGQRLRLARP